MPKSKKPRKAKAPAARPAGSKAAAPKQSAVPSSFDQGSIRKASPGRTPAKGGSR